MNIENPGTMPLDIQELIRKIPKTDLHLHLDGSVRIGTIAEIAKQEQIELPSYTVEGLNELVFKEKYASLEEYLKTFGYSCAVMQKPEYLERIAYELALDNQAEGVRYIEVRFAPQLHINKTMDMQRVLDSVDKGLLRAQQEFNQRPEVKNRTEPPFYYGIIVCAMRSFNWGFRLSDSTWQARKKGFRRATTARRFNMRMSILWRKLSMLAKRMARPRFSRRLRISMPTASVTDTICLTRPRLRMMIFSIKSTISRNYANISPDTELPLKFV
jgi:hypothetical protein